MHQRSFVSFFCLFIALLQLVSGSPAEIRWSTYLGGAGDDRIHRVRPASNGDWLIVGNTTSSTLAGMTPTLIGSDDATRNSQFGGFVVRISGDGQEIRWIRRFGRGVVFLTDAIEHQGAIYITGVSTAYGQTELIDPFNGYDKNAPLSIVSEYTGALTTHNAPNTYRSILLHMNGDASAIINGSWMGEATPGRETYGIGDIIGSWYASSDMWRYMRQREGWAFAYMNPYTINRIEAFPNGDLALLMDGGLRWAGGQDSLYRFQAGDISASGLVWKKVFDAAGNNSTVSSPEHSSVMSADLVVSDDGNTVYVSGGSNGWTGGEPYWNPFIFKFSAANGSQQWDRTGVNIGGPYGCFNLIQTSVGSLISDSYGQAITLNDDGEPLLSMWCDGGATVLTREPWDVGQSVTAQDGDGFWGFKSRTFASVFGRLNTDPTQGWIRSHRVKPNPDTDGEENATLFYGIAPVPGEPGHAWYAGFSRGMAEVNAWDDGIGFGTIARINLDASGTERLVVDRFAGVNEFLAIGHRPNSRSYLAGGYGGIGSPLVSPLQATVSGSNDGYLVAFSEDAAGRIAIDPEELTPQETSWETGYQSRVSQLVNADTWPIGSGAGDTDIGKRDWPGLLGEMWKVKGSDSSLQSYIDNQGMTLINSQYAGSFYKAFSVPGYNMFYFHFKDFSPTVGLSAAQETDAQQIRQWSYLTREDNRMDPIYGQTEFNSENFNWMARLGGLQWAFELPEVDLGTYEYNWQADQPKGMSRPYFRGYMDNWTRALFSAGRVEWNSVNYWGYTFHPVLTLLEHPPVDPADAAYKDKVRKQARAGADWMVLEAALHYIDGFTGGADTRAKTTPHVPFAGSIWPSAYIYFAEDGHMPTYDIADAQAAMSRNLVGWFPWSSYRPLNVVKSIAQRDFELPVEIQSAKPFYHLDHDNYGSWSGEGSYAQWKAAKSVEEQAHRTGFRYEFETIYLDTNYLLSSLATYRPNGSLGTFSEQNLFRLVVQGTDAGAIQVVGNTGFSTGNPAGRDPYEQQGQYGNVVMRVTKNPSASSNLLWFAVPLVADRVIVGNRLFVDMGNGVYFAVLPLGSPSVSNNLYNDGKAAHQQYKWDYSGGALAAVVMEVGTVADHGSFANFQAAFAALNVTSPATNEVEYTASDGKHLRMEWTGVVSDYPMTENGGYTLSTGGIIPRTWREGVEVNYESWNAYETVLGEEIVYQEWGSGLLRMAAGGEAVEIEVDPITAEVTYYSVNAGASLPFVSMTALDDQGDESGANPLSFQISLTEAASSETIVNLSLSGDAEMADFSSVPDISGGTVTIPQGQTSVPITLTPVDDGIEEADEAFQLNILSGAAYRRVSPYTAGGTIIGVPYLTVSGTGVPAENPAANGQFLIQRDPGRSTEAISAQFTISGDATVGADYNLTGADSFNPATGSGTLTLGSGVSSASITIKPIDDSDAEGPETLVLDLVDGSGYAPGSPAQAILTIDDDERVDSNVEQFAIAGGYTTFDLEYTRLTFLPLGSAVYLGYAEAIADFEINISSTGTSISLGDDDSKQISLPGGTTIPFFGQNYSSFFAGSNGYMTFGSGDTDFGETIADHFDLPRVSLFFDDLNPGLGGSVRWQSFPDRVIVQYTSIREYGGSTQNTGQVEFFFDGTVRISYLAVALDDCIVGLSPGSYDSGTFEATDLSSLPAIPADPWQTWQALHFSQAEIDAGLANPEADAETIPDGIPNLLEFAFGMDPRMGDAHLASALPEVVDDAGSLFLSIVIRKNPDATVVSYSLETMRSPGTTWSDETPAAEGAAGVDFDGMPMYEYQVPVGSGTVLCRVRVE